jgi:hypothetical protein
VRLLCRALRRFRFCRLFPGAPYERCRCLNSPDGVHNVVRPCFADSLAVGRWYVPGDEAAHCFHCVWACSARFCLSDRAFRVACYRPCPNAAALCVLSPALPIVPVALLLVAYQDCGHVAYGFYKVFGGLFFRLPDGVTFAAHDVL